MRNRICITIAVLLASIYVVGTNASTINGVANQIISGVTAHAVLLGEGTGDIGVLTPGTSGLPLISQGSSSDPTYATLGNSGLTNSSITITPSGCVTGGGATSLGGTATLNATGCVGWAGVTNATPGATPTWTLASGDASWTLSANATAVVTVAAGDKWAYHTIQVCQPGSGGPYTLTWPSNVKGGMVIGTTASKCNVQTFESYDGTNLYATSTGLLNQ